MIKDGDKDKKMCSASIYKPKNAYIRLRMIKRICHKGYTCENV